MDYNYKIYINEVANQFASNKKYIPVVGQTIISRGKLLIVDKVETVFNFDVMEMLLCIYCKEK